jgi:hypothetical protein
MKQYYTLRCTETEGLHNVNEWSFVSHLDGLRQRSFRFPPTQFEKAHICIFLCIRTLDLS